MNENYHCGSKPGVRVGNPVHTEGFKISISPKFIFHYVIKNFQTDCSISMKNVKWTSS